MSKTVFGSVFLLIAVLFACENADDLHFGADETFIKIYGLEGNQEGVDVVVSPDNFYYILGNSTARSNKQMYVLKTDAAGSLIWQRTLGGSGEETARDIELTPDGRLVIVGDTRSGSADKNILIFTLNADGLRLDSLVYAYSNLDEEANSVTPIINGYLISGTTELPDPDPLATGNQNNVKDGIIIRLNADFTPYTGNWDAQFGLGTIMSIEKVTQENATLFTVFSHTNQRDVNTTGLNDIHIFSIDNQGSAQGVVYFGRSENDEVVTAVARDKITNAYAVTGITTRPNGRQEVFYLFIGNTLAGGNLVDLTADFSQSQAEIPMASAVTGFGTGFFIVGATRNLSPGQATFQGDIFIKMIDRQGNDLWRDPPSITFGGIANDFIGNVAETPDQRILVVGTMGVGDVQGQRKVALIKVNREGKFAP